ncbi:MAG: hypothetical protein WC784_02040 [Candidatus Shapirobacteria bacterium]|jgi:hypothetical protein
MKKYFPVILILAALTLSACGTKTKDDLTNNSTVTGEVQKNEAKSLKDLLGLNSSQKCTYESTEDGETTKGEIIVNGKKFKQTVEITDKDGVMKVYSISDGTYYYFWNDAMKGNGTKMNIADLEKESASVTGTTENTTEQKSVDINKKIGYKCSPAMLSDSDLALPTDVKFVDYTEMMKNIQSGNLESLKNLVPSQGE